MFSSTKEKSQRTGYDFHNRIKRVVKFKKKKQKTCFTEKITCIKYNL